MRRIKADAITNGDGGKVIVWADDVDALLRHHLARGGAQGGNGGFVEVSGKESLVYAGRVETSAPQGKMRHAAARSEEHHGCAGRRSRG